MLVRIGIDHGNKQIKTRNKTFVSGLSMTRQKPALTQNYLYIEKEEEYFILSQNRLPYMRNKVADKNFFCLTLIAIAEEIMARNLIGQPIEVELGVGLPPEHLSTLTDKFKEYFHTGGDYITFEYSGTSFCVKIDKVMVFPQGFSAAYKFVQQEGRNYPTIYLIDIGGYTVDVLEFTAGKINAERCQSKESGVIPMYNEIIRTLRAEDVAISENEIDAVLKNEMTGLFFEHEQVQVIKNIAQKHIESLFYSLREENYDLKSKYTIFVGGGAMLLKSIIERNRFVGQHTMLNNIAANAIGYEDLLALASK